MRDFVAQDVFKRAIRITRRPRWKENDEIFRSCRETCDPGRHAARPFGILLRQYDANRRPVLVYAHKRGDIREALPIDHLQARAHMREFRRAFDLQSDRRE
jgi:hypothetical protein